MRDANLEPLIEAMTWETLVGSPQDVRIDAAGDATADTQLLADAGIAQWTSLLIPSYVLPGYPAVLHAFRLKGMPALTVDQLKQLQTAINQPREGRDGHPTRLFVFNSSAEPIASKDDWAAIDSQVKLEITAKMGQLLKTLSASDKPQNERGAHIERTGRMVSVRYNAFPSHSVSDGQPVVIVALQPTVEEWLKIHADDLPADREFGRFLPALQFIYDQSGNSPSLANIARSVHLSQFHFHRKFVELIGMTPKQYLLECQIAKALSLLSQGGLELSKVAELCGFAHQSHFTSRFKQATGLTPTRWRRLVHQSGG